MADVCSHRNTWVHWRLARTKKYSTKGVVRSVPPDSTIRRASAVSSKAGITRVAEVTGLDRLNIPNFMTVRPRDLDPGITYYNGKGTTRRDAHAGALMEAIERHAGESCSYPVVVDSYHRLKRRYECVNPRDIHVPRLAEYTDDLDLEWVPGFDLITGSEIFVPLNVVVCPYRSPCGTTPFMTSSNGLASGNSLTEAVCHALCEVIERDAHAISMARAQIGPAIRALLSGTPDASGFKKHRQITLSDLPRRASLLAGKIRRAGLEIYLVDMTATAGIATIYCTIVDPTPGELPNAHGGCGCHPDSRVALLRALTEAAQSRISCIQGGREDLPEIISHNGHGDRQGVERMFGGGDAVSFRDIPTYEHAFVDEDVRFLLERLPRYGLDHAIAFDLTHSDVGIPVVRLVLPAAEAWPVFHLHTGRAVFGSRVAQVL